MKSRHQKHSPIEKDAVRYSESVEDVDRQTLQLDRRRDSDGRAIEREGVEEADRSNEIALLAYALWEDRGRMDGSALDDWLLAEQEWEAKQRDGKGRSRRV
ncbi:MAG TPA: DUF2934 domain-containing protein [Bryobacteraceae bacterium]|nr:DUF2934 domain-containing protein [Bryobacteraceae bacterium]